MIIWLASYPKSGNTWLRSIISSLIYTDSGIFNFQLLNKIQQYPSRKFFKDFTQNFQDINDVSKNWVTSQNQINLDNKVKFLKTHNLNCKIQNNTFTDKSNSIATIYIVRDPRNLISSISNHFSLNIEDAKKFLMEPKIMFGSKEKKESENEIATLIGTWKEHYNFWTKKNSNCLLIKYEDLLNNIDNEIDKIVFFLRKYLKFEYSDIKKQNIINSTKFENLKKMEKDGLFKEHAFNNINKKKVMFFHKGPQNLWKNSLNKELQNEIEKIFKDEMKELKYI
ncbi:sulfotransferase domain-containing protein [Candidatus Pelagibacter sp.]|uniref:sulfotransferase domain-containing protein n=1 Tax=Candidatus Pelagibacter sp. TaxID=2024849 RepID=UPI003D112712